MLGCESVAIDLYLCGADELSMPVNELYAVLDKVVLVHTVQSLDIVVTSLLDCPAVRGDQCIARQ